MKTKNKALSLLAIASMTSTLPLATVMTSCSKFDMYGELKQDLLNQFYWICSNYRPTYNNIAFCDALCLKIEKELGFKVHKDDIFSDHKAIPEWGDSGRYKPNDFETPFGYNFYFDIPSNIDDPDYPTIILQAHTDMVCTVATDEEGKPIEYDWSNGTIPVIEKINGKTLMHSKDWKTSLGADDGIGLASILTIAKYEDKFQHGLIRCLFTVDEEDGDSGAKYLDSHWLLEDGGSKAFDFYLSLDGEILNTTWTSSGGASQVQWDYTEPNAVTALAQEMTVSIANFIGGHSALKLPQRRVSPTILLGFILEGLLKQDKYKDIRLVKCFEGSNKDNSPNAGTIPTKITFTIQGSTLPSKDEMITYLKKLLTDLTSVDTYWFQGEKDNLDKIFATLDSGVTDPTTASSTEGVTNATTKNLVTFLVGECDDEGKTVRSYQKYALYGAKKFLSDPKLYPENTYPEIGGNIGAIRLGSDVEGTSKKPNVLHFDFMGRAAYQDNERKELSKFLYDDWDTTTNTWKTDAKYETYYASAVNNAFGTQGTTPPGKWTDAGYNLPWLRPEEGRDKFINLIKKAGTATGTKVDEAPVFGWMEIGEIWQRTQTMGKTDIQYGSLGPTIHDVHTIVERLEVDSIVPMLKIALYVLKNLKGVN